MRTMRRKTVSCFYFRSLTIIVLLTCCSFALWYSAPVYAQGLRILGGSIAKPVGNSWSRIAREPQRFRIRPNLVINRKYSEGAVTGIYSNQARNLVFVVFEDGTARLWNLERGVQIGGPISGDIVAGAVRGVGRTAEIVVLHRDGSLVSLQMDGTRRSPIRKIKGLDSAIAPVLSGDGGTMAFRAVGGHWYIWMINGDPVLLPEAASNALPILSLDGTTVVYRNKSGKMVAAKLMDQGVSIAGQLDGCTRDADITAGVLTPNGKQIVLGDARGNLCAWTVNSGGILQRLFSMQVGFGTDPVRVLAISQDGKSVAAGSKSGKFVEVLSIAGKVRRVASLKLPSATLRPIVLDSERKWVFTGESSGTVRIDSIEKQKNTLIARLISTVDGWTVVGREGRFDGSQNGVNALVWSGETAEQALPVDAFSESYFEPGLLAMLDDPLPTFLNENVDDLSEEGYVQPPAVSIDPINVRKIDFKKRVTITVRLDSEYPKEDLDEIRLYHNGKRVSDGRTIDAGRAVKYKVRLLPGNNSFRAIGVGPGGIEGRLATTTVVIDAVMTPPDLQLVAIGINDYARPDWELFYARNDAETLVTELRGQDGRLFEDVRATTLLDSSADRKTIEGKILKQSSSPQDVLVIYFSGHGYALRDENGWEWYLLPYSTAWNRGATSQSEFNEKIRRYGLSSQRLMELVIRTDAQKVLLVLDSCQSGAVVETLSNLGSRKLDDAVAQKALRRIARIGGIHVLAASRAQELATELQLVPHGALTYLLLEGIQGAADGNDDKTVSVREIIEYASIEMPKLAQRLVQEPISQQPVGYSRGSDFALTVL